MNNNIQKIEIPIYNILDGKFVLDRFIPFNIGYKLIQHNHLTIIVNKFETSIKINRFEKLNYSYKGLFLKAISEYCYRDKKIDYEMIEGDDFDYILSKMDDNKKICLNKLIIKKQSPDKGKQHDSKTNKKSY